MTDKEKDFMDEEEDEILTLLNENDEEVDFYHIGTLDYKDKWYILLAPVKPMEGVGDDEMFILEIQTDEEGNDNFVPVEDQAICEAVYQEYLKEEDACGCDDDECDCDAGCGCSEGKPCNCK